MVYVGASFFSFLWPDLSVETVAGAAAVSVAVSPAAAAVSVQPGEGAAEPTTQRFVDFVPLKKANFTSTFFLFFLVSSSVFLTCNPDSLSVSIVQISTVEMSTFSPVK